MTIALLEPLALDVSDKANRFVVRVTAENVLTGIGEASLNGRDPVQVAAEGTPGVRLIAASRRRDSSLSEAVIGDW